MTVPGLTVPGGSDIVLISSLVSTKMGDHSHIMYIISVCNQPSRPTQPSTVSGMGIEYWPRGIKSAVWLGR